MTAFRRRSLGARLAWTAFFACAASSTVGCASGPSAEQKQLGEMRDTIARMQTENDRLAERIARLEVGSPESGQYGSARPTNLRVVHVGPPGTSGAESDSPGPDPAPASSKAQFVGSDDPDDASDRPVIKLTGSNVRAQKGGKGVKPADTGANDPEARKAYDAALAKVQKKDYAAAADAFTAFLVKWPDHPRADNAMYWRGECYFAQGDYSRAANEFSGTVARFPDGAKVPDALLKLAMSQEKLGQTDEAHGSYARLVHDYPHSDAARKAPASAQKTEQTSAPSENR